MIRPLADPDPGALKAASGVNKILDSLRPQNLGQGWPWPSTVMAGVPTE
jgi:hypothetical protein